MGFKWLNLHQSSMTHDRVGFYGEGLMPKLSQTRSNVSQSMRFTSDVARYPRGTVKGVHVGRGTLPKGTVKWVHVRRGTLPRALDDDSRVLLHRLCSILSLELACQALSENMN